MAQDRQADGVPANSRYADLIDVAAQLFSKHGYEGTTVRMIADQMGVKSGSLYSHIRSKEEVLARIVVSCAEEVLAVARTMVEAAPDEPEAKLRALCHAHLKVLVDRRAEIQIYFHEWRKLNDASRAEVIALRKDYEGLLASIIETGIDRGEFSAADRHIARLALLGALNWAETWFHEDGPLTYDELADAFVAFFLSGLGAQPGAGRKAS